MEHQDGIGAQVGEIQSPSLFLNIRMLFAEQPAHMREEKSPGGVVRICISFRVFVVDAMVTGPMVDGILKGDRIEDDQEQAQGPLGLVGAMRP